MHIRLMLDGQPSLSRGTEHILSGTANPLRVWTSAGEELVNFVFGLELEAAWIPILTSHLAAILFLRAWNSFQPKRRLSSQWRLKTPSNGRGPNIRRSRWQTRE
jgi:hypothetical protein